MKVQHPAKRVKAVYPDAVAIPWWSGKRAWIVIPENKPFTEGDIGAGETERRAWQDAAKRCDDIPRGSE